MYTSAAIKYLLLLVLLQTAPSLSLLFHLDLEKRDRGEKDYLRFFLFCQCKASTVSTIVGHVKLYNFMQSISAVVMNTELIGIPRPDYFFL